jgi:type I restriction enzyme S subunit
VTAERPYPHYREWDQPWLRQVPAHWRAGSLRHFTSFYTGWTPPTDDDDAYIGTHPWANIADLGSPWISDTAKTLSDEAVRGRVPVNPGDLLFSFKLSVGTVSRTRIPMYTNEAIAVFGPSELLDPAYAYFALPVFIPRNANINIYGAPLLNASLIKSAPFAAPADLDEQRRIADYLEAETSRLDTLIRRQEALVALLRERRSAVVERAVLRGLDPHAPRTSTGIAWLPDLPSHWEVLQLGFVTDTLAGFAFPSEGFTEDRSATRLLRGVNVKPGRIDWSETVRWDEETDPVSDAFRLDAGDIVLGMDRPFVAAGVRVAAVEEEDLPAYLLQRVMRIRGCERVSQDYLRYLLSSSGFLAYLQPLFTGVSVPHMSEWQARKFRMPLPPLPEQEAIVRHLDGQTAAVDRLIAKADRFIEVAKERRVALITAVVTGRIDVRGKLDLAAAA